MSIDFLLERFEEFSPRPAVVWNGRSTDYWELLDLIGAHLELLEDWGVQPGQAVALRGDFSPSAIAMFFALVSRQCVVVPMLCSLNEVETEDRLHIAGVSAVVDVGGESDGVDLRTLGGRGDPDPYHLVRVLGKPGLVLFTSGSSGSPKAAVHEIGPLLKKFRHRKATGSVLNFLLFDHWGGLNTMLHVLSNGGKLVTVRDRSPDGVCDAIEKHRVELLPASPSFLNLLLMSGAVGRYDLSSLTRITYGTEPMPVSTLRALRARLPSVELQQTYGLIELGVMRSKSRRSDSLWVKIGGEGFEWRVVGGMLEVKAESAMLGYLNAPSPFTEDRWFQTGDAVEVDGEYLKILGRSSELINVGGEKVFPAEVESVILEHECVTEVTVYKEPNPVLGNIVCARVKLTHPIPSLEFKKILQDYCRTRLEPFKIPVKVQVSDEPQMNMRLKKARADLRPVRDVDD